MHTCQTIQVYIKFNLLTFRRYIATSSELYMMNNHKFIYIYIIAKYYITNSKNLKIVKIFYRL